MAVRFDDNSDFLNNTVLILKLRNSKSKCKQRLIQVPLSCKPSHVTCNMISLQKEYIYKHFYASRKGAQKNRLSRML